MSTFLAFGRDYVGWNYEKTGNPVYLHITQTKKADGEDRPSKKPTLLAIGTSIFHISIATSFHNQAEKGKKKNREPYKFSFLIFII